MSIYLSQHVHINNQQYLVHETSNTARAPHPLYYKRLHFIHFNFNLLFFNNFFIS